MKTVPGLLRAGIVPALVLAGLLAGCGQKGPLYLPKPVATPSPVQQKTPDTERDAAPDSK